MINCPRCGTPNKPGTNYCVQCATPLAGAAGGSAPAQVPGAGAPAQVSNCPHCGKPLKPGARFCASCGKPVAQAPAAPVQVAPNPAGFQPPQQPPPPSAGAPFVPPTPTPKVAPGPIPAIDSPLPAIASTPVPGRLPILPGLIGALLALVCVCGCVSLSLFACRVESFQSACAWLGSRWGGPTPVPPPAPIVTIVPTPTTASPPTATPVPPAVPTVPPPVPTVPPPVPSPGPTAPSATVPPRTTAPRATATPNPTPPVTPSTGGRSSDDSEGVRPGQAVADFTLNDLSGRPFHLYDALSRSPARVTVMHFWATWCDQCRAEIPVLVRLGRQYGGDVNLIGVLTADDDVSNDVVLGYARAQEMRYTLVRDRCTKVAKDYLTTGYPQTFVISRDGRVCNILFNTTRYDDYERAVKECRG